LEGKHPGNRVFPFGGVRNDVVPRRTTVGQGVYDLDVPYKWGGNDKSKGIDCSGLTQCVYKENGASIPRTAITQWNDSRFSLVRGDRMEGDLVFFQTKANNTKDRYSKSAGGFVTHVGVITKDGRMLHAASKGTKVETIEQYLKRTGSKLLGAKRMVRK